MMLDAHSSMNLMARHFIAEPVFIVLCILKPEAYAQKLDRSKTPAQLHIMNWHPDHFPMVYLWVYLWFGGYGGS